MRLLDSWSMLPRRPPTDVRLWIVTWTEWPMCPARPSSGWQVRPPQCTYFTDTGFRSRSHGRFPGLYLSKNVIIPWWQASIVMVFQQNRSGQYLPRSNPPPPGTKPSGQYIMCNLRLGPPSSLGVMVSLLWVSDRHLRGGGFVLYPDKYGKNERGVCPTFVSYGWVLVAVVAGR